MRIAIIGGGGGFAGALVDHLHREGNDIYWVSPKKPNGSLSFDIKYTHFPFRASDPGVQFVLESISAEALIYLGAHDDSLSFGEGAPGGEMMMRDLASLLALAERFSIGRVLFISSQEVFGSGAPGELSEAAPTAPTSEKGRFLAGAEQMLLAFSMSSSYTVIIARLSDVYGPQVSTPGEPDFILSMLESVELERRIAVSDQVLRRPTYINDAARGVDLLLQNETLPSGIYHISGAETTTDARVAKFLAARHRDVTVEPVSSAAQLNLSCGKAARLCGYRPEFDLGEGIKRTDTWAKRVRPWRLRQQTEDASASSGKKKRRGVFRTLLSVFAPYLESIALLILFSLAAYLLRDDPQFGNIDFLLIYTVMVAAIFGKLHAAFATLLASAMHIWLNAEGQSFFAVLLRYGEFAHAAVMFALGMVVGHVRDQLKLASVNHQEEIEHQQNDYNELMVINQANTSIKNALEQRLLGYGDSFAKIISIISDLDMMEPQRVIQASVDVVRRIMRTEDVAIYQITENSAYARLAAASTQAARVLGKSIRPADYPEMNDALLKQQVYVNRQMTPGYPLMAAPVMAGNRIVNIIMLWGMEFERLSPYSMNLLTVMSRLITSSADRAFRYNQAVRAERYIPGTDVMNEAAFEEAVNMQRLGRENGVQEYTLLEILPLPGDTRSLMDRTAKPADLVRDSDTLGIRGDGAIMVLLTNTSHEDARYVVGRFEKAGIPVRVVEES